MSWINVNVKGKETAEGGEPERLWCRSEMRYLLAFEGVFHIPPQGTTQCFWNSKVTIQRSSGPRLASEDEFRHVNLLMKCSLLTKRLDMQGESEIVSKGTRVFPDLEFLERVPEGLNFAHPSCLHFVSQGLKFHTIFRFNFCSHVARGAIIFLQRWAAHFEIDHFMESVLKPLWKTNLTRENTDPQHHRAEQHEAWFDNALLHPDWVWGGSRAPDN